MADSLWDKIGLSKIGESLGYGSLVGGTVGCGLALLGIITGAISGLGWLLVPALVIAGGVAGDFANKDGLIFGENGIFPNYNKRAEGYNKKAESDYMAGLYLERNPDVRQQLLSGEAAQNGLYKTAHEHWEKFGKAEGREWPIKELLPQFNKPLNQACDIAHIPISRDGNVNLEARDFLGKVLDKNNGIAFGDWRHENPAIPDFIKQHVPVLKEKGVTDIFLEADKKRQKLVDEYFQDGNLTHLHELALLHRDRQSADCSELIKACKEAGIRVHFMDSYEIDPKTNRAYKHKEEFIKENGQEAYDAACQHFKYERDRVNQEWIDCVKKNARGKYVLLGGADHTTGSLKVQNIDEMLAEQRNEKVVHIGLVEKGSNNRIKAEIIAPKNKKTPNRFITDDPEFYVMVPGMHVEAYEAARKAIKYDLNQNQSQALQKKSHDLVADAMKLRLHLVEHFKTIKNIYPEEQAKQGFFYKLMEDHASVYYQTHSGNFDDAIKGYQKLTEKIDKEYPSNRPAVIELFRERFLKLKTECEEIQNCIVQPELLAKIETPITQTLSTITPSVPVGLFDKHQDDTLRKEGKLLSEQKVTGVPMKESNSSITVFPIANNPNEKSSGFQSVC